MESKLKRYDWLDFWRTWQKLSRNLRNNDLVLYSIKSSHRVEQVDVENVVGVPKLSMILEGGGYIRIVVVLLVDIFINSN